MRETHLNYITRPSSLNAKAPLLVMLHGYGSDEDDLFSFASELPEELFIVSVRAPYMLQPYGYAWYAINFDAEMNKWNDNEQALKSMDTVMAFIEELCLTYPIDKKNITLLGFSQGAILSYGLALKHPESIKNIIALSGYINEDLLPQDTLGKDFSRLDFYCSHGSLDQVIPVSWARKSPEILKSYGIKCQYSEFPVGHGVAPQNFFEFRNWLKERI
ncbi:MAG TPA: phospholipase [Aquaticitalea sp.]|nr:phospholipase [Aquaticitalea sp.]HNU59354.1 phospholipase [Aquaticitalea sp.]